MPNLYNDNDTANNDDLPTSTEQQTASENRVYFINEINFKRLREFQQEIYALTEMTPSLRKVVNALITNDNLDKLKMKLLKDIND